MEASSDAEMDRVLAEAKVNFKRNAFNMTKAMASSECVLGWRGMEKDGTRNTIIIIIIKSSCPNAQDSTPATLGSKRDLCAHKNLLPLTFASTLT
eukprot:1158269-Pelagomonas_calceolata.AAC.16